MISRIGEIIDDREEGKRLWLKICFVWIIFLRTGMDTGEREKEKINEKVIFPNWVFLTKKFKMASVFLDGQCTYVCLTSVAEGLTEGPNSWSSRI